MTWRQRRQRKATTRDAPGYTRHLKIISKSQGIFRIQRCVLPFWYILIFDIGGRWRLLHIAYQCNEARFFSTTPWMPTTSSLEKRLNRTFRLMCFHHFLQMIRRVYCGKSYFQSILNYLHSQVFRGPRAQKLVFFITRYRAQNFAI